MYMYMYMYMCVHTCTLCRVQYIVQRVHVRLLCVIEGLSTSTLTSVNAHTDVVHVPLCDVCVMYSCVDAYTVCVYVHTCT